MSASPYVIVFIGTDGSGKTTLAKGLAATLPVTTRYLYFGLRDFQPRALDFAAPIRLATSRDLFTISYAQPAFAVPAILYLRVHTIPMNSG